MRRYREWIPPPYFLPRLRGASEVDHLDDRLLADIGLDRDGVPTHLQRSSARRRGVQLKAAQAVWGFAATLVTSSSAKHARG
jgi:uncharacterized protein YjiS (DUF1127 family)